MAKYQITMDLQVLNHLGLNLYSSMPAVISEVVANAWDADAENVRINIIDSSKIIISDDGCGMKVGDINDRFLKVGYRKRDENGHTLIHKRLVMGRKGIGKLSLFSIAQKITVLSNKDGEKNALVIDTKNLDKAIKSKKRYYPEELDISLVDFEVNGTKIILEDLKKRTLNLERNLKRRLSRRFSIIGPQNKFNVLINNVKIKPEDRDYIAKAQYLWMYGGEVYKNHIRAQTKTGVFKKEFDRKNTIQLHEKGYNFTGWIATSVEPNALKDEDESINRISIMVRGKMAKEDILNECGETGLYAKYIFGEISAEFLDIDEEEDITTSNRQNFFEDDDRYLALRTFIKQELKEIKKSWEALRNDFGAEEATKIKVVKEWYNELGEDDKKAARKLFGKINQLTIESEEKEELVRHGILAFETLRLKENLNELDNITPEDISSFIRSAEILNTIEATYYYKIVIERLSVIKKMKEITDENALEKVIQELLSKHLWLLDPSWDRATNIPAVEEAVKTQLDVINKKLTKGEQDSRFDIRYKKASNKHVIIELKRAMKTVSASELQSQIQKYYDAMVKILEERQDSEPFEIIVLIGKKLGGSHLHRDTYLKTIKSLEGFNTRIIYYKELITNAEKMYSDFIEKNETASRLVDRFIKNDKFSTE
jgi:hypothetical protein